jgi:hypothetical protein
VNIRTLIVRLSGIGVIGALLTLSLPSAAFASSNDGSCDWGEVCLYYYNNFQGPIRDTVNNYSNYAIYTFHNSSLPLNDDVDSVRNLDPNFGVTLYQNESFNTNVAGWSVWIPPNGSESSLGPYSNEASSHHWGN